MYIVHCTFLFSLWYGLRFVGLKSTPKVLEESVRNIKLTSKNEIEEINRNAKKKTLQDSLYNEKQ